MKSCKVVSLCSALISIMSLPCIAAATQPTLKEGTILNQKGPYYRTNEGNIILVNKTHGAVTVNTGACSGDQGTNCVTHAALNHQYLPGATIPLFTANRDGTASGRFTLYVAGDPVHAPQKAQLVFNFEKGPIASSLVFDRNTSPYYGLKETTSGPTGLFKSGCNIDTRRKSVLDHNKRTHYNCTLTLIRVPLKP